MVSTSWPAALGADDEAGADLAQLDHVGHLHHAVENAQAGVRNVVDQAFLRQAEAMVNAAGRGRLEIVAADRGVHQCADVAPVEARAIASASAALSTLFSLGSVPAGQNRALANAGHQFQPALGQPQPAIERLQTGLELVGRDDFVRQRVGQRSGKRFDISSCVGFCRQILDSQSELSA